MYTLLHLAALTATVMALSRIFSSVHVKSAGTALLVAVVFSVLNFFLGWFIKVVLIVPALLTLGLLFLVVPFIVNTVLLWITDKLIKAFEIETFGALLASSAVITVVNAVFHMALHAHQMSYAHPGPPRWI